MTRFWRHSWFLPTCLISVGLISALITAFDYLGRRHDVLEVARTAMAEQLRVAAVEIDSRINTLVPVNIELSEDITSGRLAPNEQAIEARLFAIKERYPHIFGVGVAYVPGQFPNRQLYGPLLVNRKEGQTLVYIDEIYDYTEPEREFYHRPLAEGPVWQEPHYGQASQAFIANFTAPFFDGSKAAESKPAGVVFTSMSLEQYQDLVGRQDFGSPGFGFLLSAKGAFVSHPTREYVETNKTLADWIGGSAQNSLQGFVRSVSAGARAFAERVEPESGTLFWVFTEPIISTGWTLGAVFNTQQIPGYVSMNRALVRMIVALVLLAAILLGLMLRRKLSRVRAKRPSPVEHTTVVPQA